MTEQMTLLDKAWEHSNRLFDLLLETANDRRIDISIRMELLQKVSAIVEASRQEHKVEND
jgi:hypothetical protein